MAKEEAMTTPTTRRLLAGLAAAAVAVPVTMISAGAAQAATLSDDTVAMLQYMVAEEKLARDVYTVLGDTYDVAVFDTIARSEARHMASVDRLLDYYGITNPTDGDAAGTFDNTDLQALYDKLVQKGLTSLSAAADVGITIEKVDIADLDDAIATTEAADITRVLQNLRSGSENHLAAFTALKADPTATHPADGSGAQKGVSGRGQGRGAMSGQGRGAGMQGSGLQAQDGTGVNCTR
jgi:hypothetical protein